MLASLAALVQEAESAFDPEAGRSFLVGLALVFAATGLVAAPLALALLRARVPLRSVFFARWGFTHVSVVLLVAVGVSLVEALMMKAGWFTVDELFPALFATIAILGSGALMAGYYARKLHPERLAALGWLPDARAARAVPAALLGYLMLVPALFGVGILWSVWGPLLGAEDAAQDVVLRALELTGGQRWLGALLMVGVAPLLEEWLFRGFLQPLFVQNLREPGGIAVTSLLFAALHGSSAFLPIFCLSLYLGWVQLQSHRLFAAWAVHAAHNALTLLLLWNVPDVLDVL